MGYYHGLVQCNKFIVFIVYINYIYSMDTRLLRLFLDLAKTKNFSATAKKHFRTQPAVSIAIKRLETDLGLQLIDRKGRGIKLTPEAEILKDQMIQILEHVDDLRFEASLAARRPAGRVKIATIHSVGLYELSSTIKLFVKKYRDIQLDIRYDSSQKIYDLVENREVDLGIVAFPRKTPAIEVIPMVEDEMVVITPTGEKLGSRASVSLQELSGKDFVAFSESVPTRQAIDQVLQSSKVKVNVRFENENIETIKKAVEVGIGLSIVPIKCIEKEKQNGQLTVLKINGQTLKRSIGILKSRKYPLNRAATFFIEKLFKKSAA
ncbi:MAG: hypothetical protein AUJ72_02835 [Candidatus Omnitrophica bacterium CG1_02_46_14]|nr:MAG: hypothetical protein AUJ72_02835 [Candidatus Omnitrophica bacterium CG1_02_46_14]